MNVPHEDNRKLIAGKMNTLATLVRATPIDRVEEVVEAMDLLVSDIHTLMDSNVKLSQCQVKETKGNLIPAIQVPDLMHLTLDKADIRTVNAGFKPVLHRYILSKGKHNVVVAQNLSPKCVVECSRQITVDVLFDNVNDRDAVYSNVYGTRNENETAYLSYPIVYLGTGLYEINYTARNFEDSLTYLKGVDLLEYGIDRLEVNYTIDILIDMNNRINTKG